MSFWEVLRLFCFFTLLMVCLAMCVGLYGCWVKIRLWYVTTWAEAYSKVLSASHEPVPDKWSVNMRYPPPTAQNATGRQIIDGTVSPYLISSVPSFSELLHNGTIGPHQPFLLGYADGKPLTGSWKSLYSSAIAGLQGSGKTTTIRFLAAQAALQEARFVVADPHAETESEDSLAETLMPLQSRFLCAPACDFTEIVQSIQLVQTHLDDRLHGGKERYPLLLCIDEFTKLMRSESLAQVLIPLLESIAQEGRKVGVFAMLSGQIWTVDRAGGSAVRDALASCYVHRIKRNQARLLIAPEEARKAESLQTGQALLYQTNGDFRLVSIPNTTAADVEQVAQRLQPSSNGFAIIAKPQFTAEEARIIGMFRDDMDVSAIIKKLYPDATNGGGFQQKSKEVQAVLRRAFRL